MKSKINLILLFIIFGCATVVTMENQTNKYKRALSDSFDLLAMSVFLGRFPQSEIQVSEINNTPFNKGEVLNYLVFPKSELSNYQNVDAQVPEKLLNELSREDYKMFQDAQTFLLRPVEIIVKAIESKSCFELVRNDGGLNYSYFFGGVKEFKDRKDLVCTILNLSYKNGYNEDLYNEIISTTLYIDSNYKSYGKKLIFSEGKDSTRVTKVRTNNLDGELGIFPVNLPNFKNNDVKESFKEITSEKFSYEGSIYSKRIVNKNKTCEKFSYLKYKKNIDGEVVTNWCKGDKWPTFINTKNYLSVKVKK